MKKEFGKMAVWLLGVLMLGLAGCASVPMMSESVKTAVLQSIPPANKSFVFVIRPKAFVGGAGVVEIMIDDKIVGSIPNGTFFVSEVDSGKHDLKVGAWTFGMNPEIAAGVSVVCSPGKSYYYHVKSRDRYLLSVLSEDEARIYLKESGMVQSSKFTRPQ